MELFLGIIFGGLASYFGFNLFYRKSNRNLIDRQSDVLLEKIQNVCKLVTVEGDFAEIYHYENVKERFLSLVSSKKKAIILINAKVLVGFDLTKIITETDKESKTITLKQFPKAQMLSVESDLRYYDKSDGYFNKFEATDLTELQTEAKNQIIDKVPKSGLLEKAQLEALESILLMEKIVETIGWKLDYKALELSHKQQMKIQDGH